MSAYLAFDTSNYTTSVAVYDSASERVIHRKKLLPVKPGEKGIRQSDAVFHHTQQLRELIPPVSEDIKAEKFNLCEVKAVGASIRPRWSEDSYMPCFTVGYTQGLLASELMGTPLYKFSHQEGHIAAALYSSGQLKLLGSSFLAFHVSGGTTEALMVTPSERCPVSCRIIASSTDLKAGQAIDRVGVMLGLDFPCGPALERLALLSTADFDNIKVSKLSESFDCSLSGLENKCKKMLDDGEESCDIALFCIKYIEKTILLMAEGISKENPALPIVFSGGVMSNSIIRETLSSRFNCFFAAPEFSSDNAAGIAVLTAYAHEKEVEL